MVNVKWSLIFILGIILQSTLISLLSIEDIKPDLIIILLVIYGLQFGQISTTIAGFGIGLFQDFLISGVIGISSLSKSIAGFIAGTIGKKKRKNSLQLFVLVLFCITLIHDVIFYTLYKFGTDMSLMKLLLRYSLPSTLYTVIVGTIINFARKF